MDHIVYLDAQAKELESLLSGYLLPQVRNIETILPDQDTLDKITDRGLPS
jgi:hypothetical protein